MVSKWLTWPCHDHKTNAVSRIGAPPLPRGMIAPHSITASSRAVDSRPAGPPPTTSRRCCPSWRPRGGSGAYSYTHAKSALSPRVGATGRRRREPCRRPGRTSDRPGHCPGVARPSGRRGSAYCYRVARRSAWRNTIPSVQQFAYHRHEFEGYQGNVGFIH